LARAMARKYYIYQFVMSFSVAEYKKNVEILLKITGLIASDLEKISINFEKKLEKN
jgi:hypothetical protein